MDVPTQYLIHVTNRGPETHSQVSGDPGRYNVFMKQPLKDVNKFGMMMYSVPKTLDIVQPNNQQFNLLFTFGNGDVVIVPVVLPQLDYYDMYMSQELDVSGTNAAAGLTEGRTRSKKRLSFDEVLQTTINWSIMQQFEKRPPNTQPPLIYRLCDKLLARIGCIVEFDKSTGCYKFTFGYKGQKNVANPGTITQHYTDDAKDGDGKPVTVGVVAESGAPCHCEGSALIQESDGEYEFVSPTNNHYNEYNVQGINGPFNGYDPVNGDPTGAEYDSLRLVSVAFQGLSERLQLMLGLDSSTIGSSETVALNTVKDRGHIILVNYDAIVLGDSILNKPDRPTGMVEFHCNIPPNLDPPSFLYLQLLVPGTRSKILGQSDERGGWALPTTQNLYMSRYDNLPKLFQYDPLSSRLMPAVTSQATYDHYHANVNANADGIGFNFDPIPRAGASPAGVAHRAYGRNWALTGNDRSRFIMIGGVDAEGRRHTFEAGARKRLRSNFNPDANVPRKTAFGVGRLRQSSCFTTTLIEPNWLFTSTENVTMQTVDVQLMFGDTSETVQTVVGQPVQFTIIASP